MGRQSDRTSLTRLDSFLCYVIANLFRLYCRTQTARHGRKLPLLITPRNPRNSNFVRLQRQSVKINVSEKQQSEFYDPVGAIQCSQNTVSTRCAPKSRERHAQALFPSIPLEGHIRRLLVQARTLAHPPWEVRFASFEGLATNPPGVLTPVEVLARATNEPSVAASVVRVTCGVARARPSNT
jgi:hypothetical protein